MALSLSLSLYLSVCSPQLTITIVISTDGVQGKNGHLYLVVSINITSMVFEVDPTNGLVVNVFPILTQDETRVEAVTSLTFDSEKRLLYIGGSFDDITSKVILYP